MSEAGQCQDKAGFLFSHACDRPAQWQCSQCRNAICEQHAQRVNNETLCTACTKRGREAAKARGEAVGRNDDPYLYASYYYAGYGYYGQGSWGWDDYETYGGDANDFTEADGASLRDSDDEAWEQDMGAS